MRNKNAIIIGKGPSLLKTKKDYIESFDDIIICNRPVYKGYEHILPLRATYQFRNNSTTAFSKQFVEELGLKSVYSTALLSERLVDEGHYDIPVIYGQDYLSNLTEISPSEGLQIQYGNNYKINPSTGIIAFSWAVNSEYYDKISLIGFDMMQVGEECYYFSPEEYQQNIKYLLGTDYTPDGKRKNESRHNPNKLIQYIIFEIKNHPFIEFEFVTNNLILQQKIKTLNNVKVL